MAFRGLRIQGSQEIWSVPLSGYIMVVLLVNRHATDHTEINVDWDDIGLPTALP